MKKGLIFGVTAGAILGGLISFGVAKAIEGAVERRSTGSAFTEYNNQAPTHFTAYAADSYPDLTYAAENAVQAVVSIENKAMVSSRGSQYGGQWNPFFEFFGIPEQQPESRRPQEQAERLRTVSAGSGVLISADGYIVTNNHVAENATELVVTTYDDKTYTARLIGTDPTTDIALLKIEVENAPFLPFGNSDDLRLGEWVLAIGSPYELQSTITAGIISAKGRNLDVIENEMRLESFIQTDAAVNPGNSGGALVNTRGELIGINTVIKSPTGTYAGYSFAVPSSIVKKVADDLREYGVVQRAMLGLTYRPIDNAFLEELGEETGITERGGLYVNDVVAGGGAEAAGIRKGDVLLEMNGQSIADAGRLAEQIARYRPNDRVTILAKRGNEMKQFEVTLRNRAGNTDLIARDYSDASVALGGQLAEIDNRTKDQLNIEHGIQVVRVDEGGILSRARVKSGYIITHINERPVRSLSDLYRITDRITFLEGVYPDGRFVNYSIGE
jgi:Do/DeqQ family serine protease